MKIILIIPTHLGVSRWAAFCCTTQSRLRAYLDENLPSRNLTTRTLGRYGNCYCFGCTPREQNIVSIDTIDLPELGKLPLSSRLLHSHRERLSETIQVRILIRTVGDANFINKYSWKRSNPSKRQNYKRRKKEEEREREKGRGTAWRYIKWISKIMHHTLHASDRLTKTT